MPATPDAERDAAAADDPEQLFLQTTAAHLCTVQSTVYRAPEELAAAYESAPAYPGLSDRDVRRLRRRLDTEPAFARRLNVLLQQTCSQ